MIKRVENKGFTLIELLVTVAILGILAAILVPSYVQYIGSAKAKVCEVNRLQFVHSFKVYKVYDGGNYSLVDAVNGSISALSAERAGLKCPSGGEITAASSVTTASITCKLHGSLTVDMSDVSGGNGGIIRPEDTVLGVVVGDWNGLCADIIANKKTSDGKTLTGGKVYAHGKNLYVVGNNPYLSWKTAETVKDSPDTFAVNNQMIKINASSTYNKDNYIINPENPNSNDYIWQPALMHGTIYYQDGVAYVFMGPDRTLHENPPTVGGNWKKLIS